MGAVSEKGETSQAEVYALLAEYQELRKALEILTAEVETRKLELNELNTAIEELKELKESVESLVPLGPVYVKATLSNRVVVPIGSNYLVTMNPEEARERLVQRKTDLEKALKELEKRMTEVINKISSIESQLSKLQGLTSARQTQESAQEPGKGSKQ